MKSAVLKKLTSSANERKAFECVWDMTVGVGKASKVIKVTDFKRAGLKHTSRRCKAIMRLKEKHLIATDEIDGESFHINAPTFRYAIKKWGCGRFL